MRRLRSGGEGALRRSEAHGAADFVGAEEFHAPPRFPPRAEAADTGVVAPVVLPTRAAWQAPGREITPGALLGALRRRRWLLVAGLLFGAAVAAGYLRWAVPVYDATASVRVDDRRSPTPEVIRTVPGADELNTEIEVIPSRTLAAAVADSLALRVRVAAPRRVSRGTIVRSVRVAPEVDSAVVTGRVQRDGMIVLTSRHETVRVAPDSVVRVGGLTLRLAPGVRDVPRFVLRVSPAEDATAQALSSFSVTRSGNRANLMVLKYRDADPELARDALNAWTRRYIAQRNTEQKAEARATAAFLQSQLDALGRELHQSEQALRAFRERERVVAPEEEASTEVTRASALQTERAATASERRALRGLLDSLTAVAGAKAPPVNVIVPSGGESADGPSPWRQLVGFPTMLRNPAVGTILAALTQVDQQRSDLLARRSTRDPEVQNLTRRQHALEEQLRGITETYTNGLGAQVEELDRQIARSGAALRRLPAREERLAQLERAPRVLDGLVTMLQTRLKEAQVAQAVADPSVRVVDTATTPLRPVAPKRGFTLLLGALCGLCAGAALGFLREARGADALHGAADVASVTALPTLGAVPALADGAAAPADGGGRPRQRPRRGPGAFGRLGASLAALWHARRAHVWRAARGERAVVDAVFEQLYVEAAYPGLGPGPRCLLVTSPSEGEGKSTTALMLARAMARAGQLVLLVDADLRRGGLGGSVADLCGIDPGPGTAEVLGGATTFEGAVHAVDAGRHALYVLPAGVSAERPAALLGSRRLERLLGAVEPAFDLVVIDTPPVNVVADASMLATHAHGVVVVARAGATTRPDLAFALERLGRVRAPVLGVVLNEVDLAREAGYDPPYRRRADAAEAYFAERV